MSKLTPPDRLESTTWQYWLVRVMPMLYVTILTIALPNLLRQPSGILDVGALQEQKLQQQLRSISIKVLAHGETIGSGVLFHKHDRVYTVVTNAHVIQSTSAPFQLQTADGKIYAAALIVPPTGQNRDLSVLRFQSIDRTYHPAKLAAASPKIGDRVWSSGFSLENNEHHTNDPAVAPAGLTISSGQITQILQVAVVGGYRIAADNAIKKGMSGGPLIDRSGELIGINCIRTDPMWQLAATLEDGSKVSGEIRQQLHQANWVIPSEFINEYTQNLKYSPK
jgi:S1-C subfamily serine protease